MLAFIANYIHQLSSYNEVPITFSIENNWGNKNAQNDTCACIPGKKIWRRRGRIYDSHTDPKWITWLPAPTLNYSTFKVIRRVHTNVNAMQRRSANQPMTNHHTTLKKEGGDLSTLLPQKSMDTTLPQIPACCMAKMTAQHFHGDNIQFLTWWQFITVIDTNYTA